MRSKMTCVISGRSWSPLWRHQQRNVTERKHPTDVWRRGRVPVWQLPYVHVSITTTIVKILFLNELLMNVVRLYVPVHVRWDCDTCIARFAMYAMFLCWLQRSSDTQRDAAVWQRILVRPRRRIRVDHRHWCQHLSIEYQLSCIQRYALAAVIN